MFEFLLGLAQQCRHPQTLHAERIADPWWEVGIPFAVQHRQTCQTSEREILLEEGGDRREALLPINYGVAAHSRDVFCEIDRGYWDVR
jgi:hypothetical protein